jgi:hypothetical protein
MTVVGQTRKWPAVHRESAPPRITDIDRLDAQGILRIDNVVGSVSRLEGAHATTRIHHAAGRRGGMRASTHSDGV